MYEPSRVQWIIDVGDDVRFGERKVLLDGATPVWGRGGRLPPETSNSRCTEPSSSRAWIIRKTPLPGDYPLRPASGETSSGRDRRDIYLFAVAGIIAVLGFGAIGLSIFLGRRRPQH